MLMAVFKLGSLESNSLLPFLGGRPKPEVVLPVLKPEKKKKTTVASTAGANQYIGFICGFTWSYSTISVKHLQISTV